MNVQFKKGVLEMIVLLLIAESDKYGYELVIDVNEIIEIKEGTIYPLLKRLTNEKYCETYIKESNEGPARKYYKITSIGFRRLKYITYEWRNFSMSVNQFIGERWMKNE